MIIGIITYNHPHRKTQDLIWRLLSLGCQIELFLLPWEQRQVCTSIYPHRPNKHLNIPVKTLCKNLRITYHNTTYENLAGELEGTFCDKIIIGGAGVLPKEICRFNIINSHPGYLPMARGLDALKWSIFKGYPIGVTTHLIGEEADTGVLIERRIVPVYFNDTFHSVAQRVYDTEIEMMCDALTKEPEGLILKAEENYPLNRRMNHYDELRMMERFNSMIKKL